jgi:putative membrane protein
MKRLLAVSFALITILVGFGTVRSYAQDQLNTDDLLFLQRAAKNGALEVRIGQLALEHSETQAVKALGQRMIDDHTRGNKELLEIAVKKGVKLPADEPSIVNLPMAKVSGKEFDRMFRQSMIADHETDIAMYEQDAKFGADMQLKDWATKMLILLRQHLNDAKLLPEIP